VGQKKPTIFRVLWVAGEPQDEAPWAMNKLRLTESEALTRLDPERLRKKLDGRGDERIIYEIED
jgi:hypothetical protein